MNKLVYIIVLLSPIVLFAQTEQQIQRTAREMKAMDEIYQMDKTLKNDNTVALNKILSFQNEVRDEIRKNRSKLSLEQYDSVQRYERNYWQTIVKLREQYSFNSEFLRNHLTLLNKYRNETLDYLYNKLSE